MMKVFAFNLFASVQFEHKTAEQTAVTIKRVSSYF